MKFITMLRNTNSRIGKEAILENADAAFIKVLRYTYEPTYNYGVSNMFICGELGEPSQEMFDLLDKLRNRELTGNAARKELDNFIKLHGHLIAIICRKDLDCGIGEKTIHKVFPELITKFNVQLAISTNKREYPMIAQTKYDGVRTIAIKHDGKVKLFTRNGKQINCPDLCELLNSISIAEFVLDGELIQDEDKRERTTISGRVNSALHNSTLTNENVKYVVFDWITNFKDFKSQSNSIEYVSRYNIIKGIILPLVGDNQFKVEMADFHLVGNREDEEFMFNKAIACGEEGIILKDPKQFYSFKRNGWIKLKVEKTMELKCIEELMGEPRTKYEYCIGALTCCGNVDGKYIKVNVGSGLTDNDRECLNLYVGKTIEIKYNEIIPSTKANCHTLFLPRFVSVRFDKQC